MTKIQLEVSRKVGTIFGGEVEKKATVVANQFSGLADIASVYSEDQLTQLVNFTIRILAQRQANNDLKAASSGLSDTDSAAVKSILKAVQQAKELDDDPIETANRLLSKPKFQHLRAIFEGASAGSVTLDYTGTELVDGVATPILVAPKERARD